MLPASLPVPLDTSIPALVFLTYTSVAAGFPSPADDYATKATDLNAALIKNPQATFLMRIAGSSMRDAGIDDGDVVLVDRALRPRTARSSSRWSTATSPASASIDAAPF